ncbi:hypothetical protein GCM10009623_29640 [Nocardioides aestuarii]|uniref:Uncharacterized protein n=1 Tax=Nocardioides aestuarii TaxID=252231 RepID=A0ABW4TQA1_9ACTN
MGESVSTVLEEVRGAVIEVTPKYKGKSQLSVADLTVEQATQSFDIGFRDIDKGLSVDESQEAQHSCVFGLDLMFCD